MKQFTYILISLAAIAIIVYVAKIFYDEHEQMQAIMHMNGLDTYKGILKEVDILNTEYNLSINIDSMRQSINQIEDDDTITLRIGQLVHMKDSIIKAHQNK